MASRTPPKPARTAPACPICGKPATVEARPFCSPRCRQVDLNRWLTGAYAIPVVEEDGAEDDDQG
jgi:endogenous inhibitor of DNA gyrase (YacG/DUF329 family)